MSTHLEAVYENGTFRPLQPVRLAEHQHVTVTIDEQIVATSYQGQPEVRWQAFCDAQDAHPKDMPALKVKATETPSPNSVPLIPPNYLTAFDFGAPAVGS